MFQLIRILYVRYALMKEKESKRQWEKGRDRLRRKEGKHGIIIEKPTSLFFGVNKDLALFSV